MALRRSLLCLSVFVLVFCCAALAEDSRERTKWGHNINIGPGEEADEVTCFGCSVRIRGHVNGDVTTFGGSIVVEDAGKIGGDTAVFGGTLRLDAGTSVGGDAAVFGGHLERDSSATIGGDISEYRGGGWIALIFGLPFVLLGILIALIIWVARKLMQAKSPATAPVLR